MGPESGADPGEHLPVPRAPEAVIAYVEAAVRPHVRKHPAHARLGRHRRGVDLSRGRVLVLQRDVAIFPREDTGVADGHAQRDGARYRKAASPRPTGSQGTTPSVFQTWAAPSGTRSVGCRYARHVARTRPDRGVTWPRQSWREGPQAPSAESPPPATRSGPWGGERRARVQGWSPPTLPIRPPMHLGSHARACQAAADAPHEEVVEGLRVVAGPPAECRRERTGRHDVRHRPQETLCGLPAMARPGPAGTWDWAGSSRRGSCRGTLGRSHQDRPGRRGWPCGTVQCPAWPADAGPPPVADMARGTRGRGCGQ